VTEVGFGPQAFLPPGPPGGEGDDDLGRWWGVPRPQVGYWPLTTTEKGFVMSGTDKLQNKAQELAGQGKEALGKATDDRDLEAEGHKDQAAGNAKQAGEKVKDIFK
jgi:uncharacterized protein YjbJ (UPF0337 family)